MSTDIWLFCAIERSITNVFIEILERKGLHIESSAKSQVIEKCKQIFRSIKTNDNNKSCVCFRRERTYPYFPGLFYDRRFGFVIPETVCNH